MATMLRPTLVVGVGGTGSEAAERIFQAATQVRDTPDGPNLVERRLLGIIGLDTDDNDHRRRQLRETNKIRFSAAKRISDLVRRNPEVEGRWFYRHDELAAEILNMSLLDGAGQVRLLTRLALHDAFKYDGLEAKLRLAMQPLTSITNQQAYQGQLNVLIIGSLAGGTGCGSFLQVALALREIAKRESVPKLAVRGLFLLPDVYVHGAGIAGDQVANVAVNGYAALRELNAVMQATSGRIELDRVNLEFMPGAFVKFGQMPFDVVTLIDYETSRGQNLGRELRHYKDLLYRAAFTQLFLPLGQEVDQRSVNSVQLTLAGVEMGTTNSYASSSTFKITYPQDAILDHLTACYAREVLEGDWLALDRAYRRRVDVYDERRRSGDLSVKFPDRGASFIADLEQMARDRRPLMVDVHQNVHKELRDKEGRVEKRIAYQTFMTAFEAHVLDNLRNSSEEVKEAYEISRVGSTQFKDASNLVDDVNRRERILDDLLRTVEDAARQQPDSIYENYWAQGLSLSRDEFQDHHLQKHVVAPAPHLVEVRYLLYLLQREIARRLDELKPESFLSMFGESRRSFRGDDQRGDAAPELLARQRAEEIAGMNPIGRLASSRAREFPAKYATHFNRSLSNLFQHLEEATLKRSYERLLVDINQLQRLLELLFGDLEGLQGEMVAWIADDLSRHELVRGAELGNRYVYAGRRAKEQLWEGIKSNAQGQKIGREANSRLVSALFAEARARRQSSRMGQAVREGNDQFSVRELFKQEVVEGFCRRTLEEDMSDRYSLSIAEAVRREASLAGRGYVDVLSELVRTVATQTAPFIQLVQTPASQHGRMGGNSGKDAIAAQSLEAMTGSEIVYWAMHTDGDKEIGPPSLIQDLFKHGSSVSVVTGAEYGRNEILCVAIRYNFPMTALAKLQPGDSHSRSDFDVPSGRYDRMYRDWIAKLVQSEARDRGRVRSKLTPHLDMEWHKPGSLPEIFTTVEESKTDTLYQDLVLALGLNYLRRESDAGDPAFVFYDPSKFDKGGARSVVTLGHSMDRLLMEAKRRPDITSAARAGFDAEIARARAAPPDTDFRQSAVYRGIVSPQLMADLLEIARNRQMRNVDDETARIIRAHLDMVHSVLKALRPDLEAGRIRQLFSVVSRDTAEQALALLAERRLPGDTFARVEQMLGMISEAVEQQT